VRNCNCVRPIAAACLCVQEGERAYKAGMADGGSVEATMDSLREDLEAAVAAGAAGQEKLQLAYIEEADLRAQVWCQRTHSLLGRGECARVWPHGTGNGRRRASIAAGDF
jgi:hypothetical protein